ncbi:MAG: DNA polymerase III subunit delta [Lachnospiraceae bacterium]|nr:DNA polymerase III subunit delta [Lachnospiraceae bacterium]
MKSLNEDIKNKSFRPVYLLYGEEAYLKNRYKKRLHDAILPDGDTMNFSAYMGKGIDVKGVIDQAETMPFFAEHRLIQIEDSGFFKNACPELAEYLPQMPQETIFVFVESEVDKRGKLFKRVKDAGRVVEMGRQDARTLTTWVLGTVKKDGKKITQDALSRFLELTGDDMENIDHELEKLLCYTLDGDAIAREAVEAVCTGTTEDQIFKMIDAMTQKQQRLALDLYYDLLSLKVPPMRILFLIARQFNQMLQVKDLRDQGLDDRVIASKAGMAPFVAKRVVSQAAHFSKEALRQGVEDCVEAETSVKTGRLNDQLAVEMLLVKFSERPDRGQ